MAQSIRQQIVSRIYGRGRGWVFSPKDFSGEFLRIAIDAALFSLAKSGTIRRILPGLYYYPAYSELLQKCVAPDMQQVAKALARKYNWKIFPEGNTALNYLGLSTQIPAKYIFISSGHSRKYKIGNMDLEFRHRVLTETMINDEQAMLAVQAIKSMGRIHADDEFVKSLSKRFSHDEWIKIEKASHKVADWILTVIKKAKEIAKNG